MKVTNETFKYLTSANTTHKEHLSEVKKIYKLSKNLHKMVIKKGKAPFKKKKKSEASTIDNAVERETPDVKLFGLIVSTHNLPPSEITLSLTLKSATDPPEFF